MSGRFLSSGIGVEEALAVEMVAGGAAIIDAIEERRRQGRREAERHHGEQQ